MKITLTLLSIALLMASVSIRAEETKPSKSEVLADQLLTLMQVDKLRDADLQEFNTSNVTETKFYQSMNAQDKETYKLMVEKSRAQSKKLNSWETLKPAYIQAYSETYSEEELQGMIEFYKSPLGQAWTSKQLQLITVLGHKMQGIVEPAMLKLNDALRQSQDSQPLSPFGFSQTDLGQRRAADEMLHNTQTLVAALQKLAYEHQYDPSIAPSLVARSPFPKKIEDLVGLKYLNQEEYNKLTKNIQFDYFPPAKNPTSQDFIILVGHIPGYVVYGFLSGEIQLQKIRGK